MKTKNKILIFTALVITLLVATPGNSSAKVKDAIIAIVNNEVVTYQELTDYLNAYYLQLKSDGKNDEQIESIFHELESDGLNRLIEDRLILQEANKLEMKIRDKSLEERFQEIKNRYRSEDEFIQALAQSGLTPADLKNKINDQFKVKSMVDSSVRSKIFVNPHEVTDYYNKNLDKFTIPERFNLDSIYVSKRNGSSEPKQKIESAFSRINEGKPFEETAREFSESSSIGIIEKGKMLPKIESAVQNLSVGEVSEIIEVDQGYYIFKVKEKLPMMQATLEEVKDKIYEIIFNQKFLLQFQQWISKLRNAAYIEIKQ